MRNHRSLWTLSNTAVAACLTAATALTGTAEACSVSQFALAEKGELPRYTFALFYKPGTTTNEESLATLKALEAKWKDHANVAFEAIDVTTPQGENVAKYWQIEKFPTTHVVAPTGWTLATFPGKLDAEGAAELITSPGKVALKDALAKHKTVFLVLGKRGMKGFEAAVKAADNAVKSVREFMKVEASKVVVDPTDKRELRLLNNMGLEKAPDEATVFVTYGKGRAVLQEVWGEDVEERLSFTVQLLTTADQCSLGQEIAGEPLLLGKQ